MPESFRENLNQNGSVFPLPAQQNTRDRKAAVMVRAASIAMRCLDALAFYGKEVSWGEQPQIGVLRDLKGAIASSLGEIPFDQGLQTPSDPPEEVLPVPGSCFLVKYLPVLRPQNP